MVRFKFRFVYAGYPDAVPVGDLIVITVSENIRKYKIETTRIILVGYKYGMGMALTYAVNHTEINTIFSIARNDHGEFIIEYNGLYSFKNVKQ